MAYKLQTLSLDEVINACWEESQKSRSQESGFCLELFRRALQDRNDEAWAMIEKRYRPLVCHWLLQCAPKGVPQTEVKLLAGDVFERFWRTLTRRPVKMVEHFQHVGAILRYLQQCSVSVMYNHELAKQREARLRERLTIMQVTQSSANMEEIISEKIDQRTKLRQVSHWIRHHVTDPEEKLVLSLLFEDDLSPAQVAERHPEQFSNPLTVRRIRDRILKRARRAMVFP